MANLHDTRMGVQLIRGTMPEIALQLKRIADVLVEDADSFDFGCARDKLIDRVKNHVVFDPSDPTMAAGGQDYWNQQVERAMDFLTNEINDLVDNVVNDLLEGGYAMQRE